MFNDMLKAKDEVVASLSNLIFKTEGDTKEEGSRTSSFDQPDVVQSMLARDSTASTNSERVELRELERYKVKQTGPF